MISFFEDRGGTPVWFRLWVDGDGLVHRAQMRAHGHFMDHRYFDFDAPFDIEPPTGPTRQRSNMMRRRTQLLVGSALATIGTAGLVWAGSLSQATPARGRTSQGHEGRHASPVAVATTQLGAGRGGKHELMRQVQGHARWRTAASWWASLRSRTATTTPASRMTAATRCGE
ncbi:MAG: hypothetical protein ACRDKW_08180 [Actinomycetota bacterium]